LAVAADAIVIKPHWERLAFFGRLRLPLLGIRQADSLRCCGVGLLKPELSAKNFTKLQCSGRS